jgi:hypothetical protein
MLSFIDKDSTVAVSENGLTTQSRNENQWLGIRANTGVLKGFL